jgi:hypothetical protein
MEIANVGELIPWTRNRIRGKAEALDRQFPLPRQFR